MRTRKKEERTERRTRDSRDADSFLEELEERTESEVDAEEKLSEFMEQFGGKDYKVRVERFNKEDKAWDHLDTYPLDGFDAFAVCKGHGGGRYRLTFLNESGKYVKGGQPQIRIAAPPPGAVAVEKPDTDPLKHPLVALLLAQSEKSRQEMIELFKTISARPEPQKSTTNEVMDLLMKVRAMEPKGDDTMKKLLDTILVSVVEKGLNPEPTESGGGLMSDLKDALEAGKALGLLQPRGPRVLNAPTPAPGAPKTALPAPAPAPEAPVNPIIEEVKKYVPIFLKWAKRGESVQVAADFLVAELQEEIVPLIIANYKIPGITLTETMVLQNLIDRSAKPEEVAAILTFAPDLAPYKEWVEKVVKASVDLLLAPPEKEEQANADEAKDGVESEKTEVVGAA